MPDRPSLVAVIVAAPLATPVTSPLPETVATEALLLAQVTTAPAEPSTAPAKPKRSMADRAEAHIKSLHDRLRITSAQEPQWTTVAQVMRDNARQMEAAIEQRRQAHGLSAVDDLKAYQAIADAHAQGLQKLVPAFQALYDTMSDEQKKNADAIFGQTRHRGHRGRRSK